MAIDDSVAAHAAGDERSLRRRPHLAASAAALTIGVFAARMVFGTALLVATAGATANVESLVHWTPPGVRPSNITLETVFDRMGRSSSAAGVRSARRRERWTYVTGTTSIPVSVAIRDDDFRTSLVLDGLTYMAGRLDGVRWRGDGNGIVHGVQADLQGDPLDRAPQAVFALDAASCSIAGEATLAMPAWVVAADRPGDKRAYLYIDEGAGTIVREVMRDGKRIITTNFDRFENVDGLPRARHWRVDDGIATDALDVTVDSSESALVSSADMALPQRRIFAPPAPLAQSVTVDSSFRGADAQIAVSIGRTRQLLPLDTGTTSITIDPSIAHAYGGSTLGHATLPHVEIGPFVEEQLSTLTVPFGGGGIIGLDFFYGHVVEIDYLHQRVRILDADDAAQVFADPQTAIVATNVDQGLPLVHASFGDAQSETFALDTSSPRLYVMRPFATRFAAEIAAHWTPSGRPFREHYLEGAIEVAPYRVARFDIANARADNLIVGVQLPATRQDDLDIPFDGILGTDILRNFDLYFDYDNNRIGFRR